jgi:hypothetical protein
MKWLCAFCLKPAVVLSGGTSLCRECAQSRVGASDERDSQREGQR